jgi:hypothetical protein
MTQSALSDLIVDSLFDEFASVHGVGSPAGVQPLDAGWTARPYA